MPVPAAVCVPPPLPQPAVNPSGPETPPDASPPAGAGAAAAQPGGALPVVEDAGAPPAVTVEQLAGPVQSLADPAIVAPVADDAAAGAQAAPTATALATAVAAAAAEGAGTGAAAVNKAGDATAVADAGDASSHAGGDVDQAVALSPAAESGDAGGQDQDADPGGDFAGGGATGQTAAMSRAEAARAAPDTPRPPAAQLAEPLVRAARVGVQRVEIALEPAALGRVDVRLDFAADGRMSALIMADSRQALEALRADTQTLARALADAGIDAGGLNFGLRQREPGSDGGGFARAFGSGDGSAGSPGDTGPPPAARGVSGPCSSASGRLDIRA